MAQVAPGTRTSGELNAVLAAGATGTLSESLMFKKIPNCAARFAFRRADSLASESVSGLPPIAQFVLHAIAWCRTKLTAGAAEASPLRLIKQLPLGGKRSLSLVEADGVRFLVGGGPDSVTIIVPVVRSVQDSQQERRQP